MNENLERAILIALIALAGVGAYLILAAPRIVIICAPVGLPDGEPRQINSGL
jgi:hypothetical protein